MKEPQTDTNRSKNRRLVPVCRFRSGDWYKLTRFPAIIPHSPPDVKNCVIEFPITSLLLPALYRGGNQISPGRGPLMAREGNLLRWLVRHSSGNHISAMYNPFLPAILRQS